MGSSTGNDGDCMSTCEKNPRDVMSDGHGDEMDKAVSRFIRRMDLPDSDDIRFELIELYDLGYDHGSTMEAEFGDSHV